MKANKSRLKNLGRRKDRNTMSIQKRQLWSEADMQQALNCVTEKSMGFKLAAKICNVPKTTLRRRFAKKQGWSKGDLGGRRTIFSKDVEKEIADHIIDMETRFFGLTNKNLRRLKQNGRMEMGERFPETKSTDTIRTPENTSLARAQAFNKPNIGAYFLALSAILAKYNFPPENMYNMDESGLSTVQKKSQKIYASKGRKQVGAVSSAERGKHVTIVCAMNAIGTFVPPAFIFPRERMKDELMNDAPVGSVCFAQEKRYTKASKENPVLLLLDGHGSHKGLQAMEL
ncbi:hypothetical protein NQ318_012003 [Aromia moschata]|uniref:HTH psq-type domain-containing protein n=1 Tax=Aromia moschata TaxID=1265417 RepID=A0AAV8Y8C2_9CUCU|nr:hypothetical protein NQ318_012003 [Aromia moschata]